MRTTLDLDDDVLLAAKEIARRRGVSIGQAVSDLVRRAMAPGEVLTTRNGVPLFPVREGASVVTPELVNRLRDEET